jgi:hypothetical protein
MGTAFGLDANMDSAPAAELVAMKKGRPSRRAPQEWLPRTGAREQH